MCCSLDQEVPDNGRALLKHWLNPFQDVFPCAPAVPITESQHNWYWKLWDMPALSHSWLDAVHTNPPGLWLQMKLLCAPSSDCTHLTLVFTAICVYQMGLKHLLENPGQNLLKWLSLGLLLHPVHVWDPMYQSSG
ncbi:uncharacterized protein ACIB01_013737 [Guaruba guarouba]